MPVYIFKCLCCGAEKPVSLSVEERDEKSVWCEREDCKPAIPGGVCLMVRQPAAPSFAIHGFSAKNGYSK